MKDKRTMKENNKTMRTNLKEYEAVEQAALKFVGSVAEGNSVYAKELFTDDAVLFGYLDGKLEHGSIRQFYHHVDTVGAGTDFKARIDVLSVEETVAVVRVLEEKWGGNYAGLCGRGLLWEPAFGTAAGNERK